MTAETVPAAFGASIYPPGLLFVAFLLAGAGSRKRVLVLIAGAAIAALGFAFALVFLLQGTGVERNPHHWTVPHWVDLAVGILLLAFALVVWYRPPRGPRAAKQRRELGLLGILGVGFLMYTPSPLYLASVHSIAKAHASLLATIVSILLVAAIYMLAIEIPVLTHALWPEATIRVVTALNTWLARYGRTIIVIASGAVGVYLIIFSLVAIVGGPAPA